MRRIPQDETSAVGLHDPGDCTAGCVCYLLLCRIVYSSTFSETGSRCGIALMFVLARFP
jgi:hypothetical protein